MSRESRSALDVLFVGALPPHPGGSAISAGQILTGLAGRGHVIRGVAPMTEDAARDGDAFAARHPALRIARFAIPYFNVSPMNPIPEEDWSREEREVERLLTGLLRERRPDQQNGEERDHRRSADERHAEQTGLAEHAGQDGERGERDECRGAG